MMQYGHIYAAICIMIKLKVMFWKLYTRIYFNVGTFNYPYVTGIHSSLRPYVYMRHTTHKPSGQQTQDIEPILP